jgi:transcriptional regulator with XRE-family HTH domain
LPETGWCPACRVGRVSKFGAPLCPACTSAARLSVPAPLWMFDSPLLRRCLAQVNLPAVAAIVRAACGLSQSDLAAIVGWSRSALGLYERGQRGGVYDIRMLLQFTDAVGMPREALLPMVLGDPGAALASDGVADEAGVQVDRRSFGGLAAGMAVAAVLPEPAVPTRVTVSHVKYFQAGFDSLFERDREIGGAALLRPALRQLQRAQRVLKESSYSEAVGRGLLVTTGYLANLGGWLAFDAADLRLAQSLYSKALEAATHADDPLLTAWVLVHKAGLACYQASKSQGPGAARQRANAAREGLLLAHRAADEARYEPMPRLHVVIALRHAYAAGLLGDKAAYQSGIRRAQRELDRSPGTYEPGWIADISMESITEEQSRGSLNLGQPDRAEKLCRDLLDGDLGPRARAFLHARLTASLLGQGAYQEALTEGTDVLTALESGVTSTRTLHELRPLRVQARRKGDHDFCARFDATYRSLTPA